MDYKPIDYVSWNFDGQGKNLKLYPFEEKLWNTAISFQDSRLGEKGHAEFVTYFSIKLLGLIKADRTIVVPAAMLHDIGSSQLSDTERKLFDDTNWKKYEPILRGRHQTEGFALTKKLLNQLDYPGDTSKVLDIILQHDTRKDFFSNEEAIVRSSDIFWKFSVQGLKFWINERKRSLTEIYKTIDECIQKKLPAGRIKEIALTEKENSLKFLKII